MMSNADSQKNAIILSMIKALGMVPFSVFYSSLILYLTNQLHFQDQFAAILAGSFLGYLFLLRIIGGYLGTYLVNHRNLILIGLVAITVATLSFSSSTQALIYPSLALLVVGNAFLVSVNCLLSELYEYDDVKRESAFILNYSSINMGYLIGFALSGYYQLTSRYSQFFLCSSFFSFAAIILILLNWNNLKSRHVNNQQISWLGYGIIITLFLFMWLMLHYTLFSNS